MSNKVGTKRITVKQLWEHHEVLANQVDLLSQTVNKVHNKIDLYENMLRRILWAVLGSFGGQIFFHLIKSGNLSF